MIMPDLHCNRVQLKEGNKETNALTRCTQVQYAAGAPNVLVASGTGEVGLVLDLWENISLDAQVQFYQRNQRDRLLAKKPER